MGVATRDGRGRLEWAWSFRTWTWAWWAGPPALGWGRLSLAPVVVVLCCVPHLWSSRCKRLARRTLGSRVGPSALLTAGLCFPVCKESGLRPYLSVRAAKGTECGAGSQGRGHVLVPSRPCPRLLRGPQCLCFLQWASGQEHTPGSLPSLVPPPPCPHPMGNSFSRLFLPS